MSRFEVPMPQMGESIAEGTVSKWLIQVGQEVQKDEPILEISTDKVDAEIPSPVSGILVEICVEEGETVGVGTTLAFVDTDEEATSSCSVQSETQSLASRSPTAPSTMEEHSPHRKSPELQQKHQEENSELGRLKNKSSPVVRKIAEERGISIDNIPGTGHLGRVTKADILRYIKDADIQSSHLLPDMKTNLKIKNNDNASVLKSIDSEFDLWSSYYNQVEHPTFPVRSGDKVVSMDRMRQLTADHMVLAKRVVPHVHSVIEVDFSSIDEVRKKIIQKSGSRFSYTAFVTWACSRLLMKYENINAVLSGRDIIQRQNANIGIAVDLDPGLIVPVIKDADELSLAETSASVANFADRARSRSLSPDEIQEATFSITNPGVLGTLVGMPIIPKGTSAILVLGAIEKRPVVVENSNDSGDELAIRKTSLFTLGFDHRIVDGAEAARFLLELKGLLEAFPENA